MSLTGSINCLHCGAVLNVVRDSVKVQCRYCKRIYENVNKNITYELTEISNRRQLREFIQAEELCALHKPRMPQCGELYWQSLLTEFGIVYVNDSVKQIPVPTFFHHSYEKGHELRDSENYRLALQYAATTDDKDFYKTQVEELDAILKRHFELMAKEPAYNIFISFKSSYTEETVDGREILLETPDSKTGKEIYDYFTKRKFNVFFSPESIGKDKNLKGMDYEPRILKALQTSQAMVLLASKTEYLSSEWVANEWKRYMYFIEKGKKLAKSLIIVYFDRPPKLPPALGAKIEHTMINAHSMNFKEELSRALDFVKPGNKKAVQIKRDIKTDFEDESLDYAGSGERVDLGASRKINHISASEAREMQNANLYLLNGNFNVAYGSFKKIAANNPSNGKAYWGMFLSRVKIKLPEKYTAGKLKGASPTEISHPEDLLFNLKNVGSEAYTLLEQAINNPTDEEFSDNLISVLMYQIAKSENKSQISKIFELLAKYIPNKSIKNLLDIMKGHCIAATRAGDVKYARELYEVSKEKLFIPENDAFNKAYLRDFATALYHSGEYSLAVEYYNTYLKASHEAGIYWNLLGCRLGGSPMRSFKLRTKADDDASKKEPKELDLDEIIERIIVCSGCNFESTAMKDLMRLLSYQIQNNYKNHKPFVECIANGILNVKGELAYIDFLKKIAMVMIFERRFADAKLYYTQIDKVIEESDTLKDVLDGVAIDELRSHIRWGLLKCRLKAIDDYEVCRNKKRLESYVEYREALNCATDAQYKYFSSVYGAHQNRREDQMRKFACSPQLRRFGSGKELMPQFGLVESFYNPNMLKTRDAKGKNSAKLATKVLAALLILSVIASGIYLGFVKTCTVSFDTGGELDIPDTVTNYFRRIEEPESMKKSGYTFRGWYTERGQKWDFASTVTFGDTVLHPEWEWGTEGIVYEALSDGVHVTGYNGYDRVVNIPATYNGSEVVTIDSRAFEDNDMITKVVISSGITSLGSNAFASCDNLTKIYIPTTVTYCQSDTFYGCSNARFYSQVNGSETSSAISGVLDQNRTVYVAGITEDGFVYRGNYTLDEDAALNFDFTMKLRSYDVVAYIGGGYAAVVPSSIEKVQVKAIGGYAFYADGELVKLTIPASIESVTSTALLGCEKLLSLINLSESVGASSAAFSGMSLTELYDISGVIETVCSGVGTVHPEADFVSRVSVLHGGYVFVTPTETEADAEGEESVEQQRPELVYYIGYGKNAILPSDYHSESYKIAKNAFSGVSNVTKVIIGNGVYEIGDYAFSDCKDLEIVIIPREVVTVGYDAFANNADITVYIEHESAPETYNENWNFSGADAVFGCTSEYGCTDSGVEWLMKADDTVIILGYLGKPDDIKTKTVKPSGVYLNPETNTYEYTFDTYELTIPETIEGGTVTAIARGVFRDRYLLQKLTLPKTVTELPTGVFSGCVSLESITLSLEGMTEYEEIVVEIPTEPDTEGDGAADDTAGTDGAADAPADGGATGTEGTDDTESTDGTDTEAAPEGDGAEDAAPDGSDTESVPNTEVVTVVKNQYPLGALFGDVYISYRAVVEGYSTYYIDTVGVEQKCTVDGAELTKTYYIPKNLKTVTVLGKDVPAYALASCSSLTAITLADGVENIGNSAFANCTGVTEITIPDTVLAVGNYSFFGCTLITSVTLPEGTVSIGDSAFASCHSMKSITIPESVTYIGNGAFANCRALTSVVISSGVEAIFGGTFSGCGALESITVPFIGAGAGEELADSKEYTLGYIFGTDYYEYSGAVDPTSGYAETYSSYALSYSDGTVYYVPERLKTVIVMGGKYIHSGAFMNVTSVQTVSIPDTVEIIGEHAFSGCSSLGSVSIPGAVTKIEYSAFRNCASLAEVKFLSANGGTPALTSIGTNAFFGCNSLTVIDLPVSVTEIGDCAFFGCGELNIYSPLTVLPEGWDVSKWKSPSGAFVMSYTGTRNKYTFVNQGGENVDSITTDRLIELPTPTNGTKYFVGWYDNPEFKGYNYFGAYYSPTDVTLYARWSDVVLDGSSLDAAAIVTKGSYNFYTDGTNGYFEYYSMGDSPRTGVMISSSCFTAARVEVYDADGNLVASSANTGIEMGTGVIMGFDTPADTLYYIVVSGAISAEGEYHMFIYSLESVEEPDDGTDDGTEDAGTEEVSDESQVAE